MEIQDIKNQVEEILLQFLEEHPMKKGSVFVVGCSSSEIVGGKIGKNSSEEAGKAVFEKAYSILKEKGVFLACQCCEHLNRALVVEDSCVEKYSLERVNAVPWISGGGSFATAAFYGLENPCLVEHIKADAGLDIGDTLIGMHLKDVAVPYHLQGKKIGSAHALMAYTRPKYIGGERARYEKV